MDLIPLTLADEEWPSFSLPERTSALTSPPARLREEKP